jgi:DNA repair photolyase
MKVWLPVDNQIYTTPIGLSSQFPFCGLPLRLDTYRGCGFQCAFCFARQRGGNSPQTSILPANPKSIRASIERALTLDENKLSIIGQFLRRRVPVHFGGMSDPFQPVETRFRVTKETLEVLASFDYPTVISTRGVMVSSSPYLDLLRQMKFVVVQFSMSSSCDEIAHVLEPRSSPPSQLLRSMETLAEAGIPVTCRWQPYVPGQSEEPAQFAGRVSAAGCSHVGFEHLKVPLERNSSHWQDFVQQIGQDLYAHYKSGGAFRDGRELVMPARQKLDMVMRTASEVRRRGMSFGAADNEFQYYSDTSCCCSGVDRFPGFENYFRHQIAYALRKCRGDLITYESIKDEWAPRGSIDRYLNSRSRIGARNERRSTIIDHIKLRWNQPSGPGSPSSFFGVKPSGNRIHGMNTYFWDEDIVERSIDSGQHVT